MARRKMRYATGKRGCGFTADLTRRRFAFVGDERFRDELRAAREHRANLAAIAAEREDELAARRARVLAERELAVAA